MLALFAAAAIYSCPVCIDWTQTLCLTVYYEHEGEDGHPYEFRRVNLVDPGCYDANVEGHPVRILWSTGVACGRLPSLLFRDGFETSTAERWDKIGGNSA